LYVLRSLKNFEQKFPLDCKAIVKLSLIFSLFYNFLQPTISRISIEKPIVCILEVLFVRFFG